MTDPSSISKIVPIYDAAHMLHSIYISATGNNSTSGWKNYFQRQPTFVYPPRFSFVREAPYNPALQVVMPFFAITSFIVDPKEPKVEKVYVADSDGETEVNVRRELSNIEIGFILRETIGMAYLAKDKRLLVNVKPEAFIEDLHYERNLASYDDHLSQHCSTECVRIDEIDHTGVKLCTEYRTVCQHIRNYAVLVVDVAKEQEIARYVEESLETAAIASAFATLIAVFTTGGPSAAEVARNTFVVVFTAELAGHLTDIVKIDVEFRSEWV